MKKTFQEYVLSLLRPLGWEILGSFLTSLAIQNFAVTGEFPMTGFSGIALIFYRLFGTPIGIITILLNIPFAVISWKILGGSFLLRSLRCMIIQSLMIDYLCPLLPAYEGSRILSALCCGVLSGIGYGIIYRAGSSTGGVDFLTLSIKARKPHIPLGTISFICDFAIVLTAGIIFRDVDGVIYGVLITYLTSMAIDRLMFGANAGKLLLIVTGKGKETCTRIDEMTSRGSTLLPARGGYRQEDKEVVMCACSTRQVYQVLEAAKTADPGSFSIILDSSEVHGEGFKYTHVGQS